MYKFLALFYDNGRFFFEVVEGSPTEIQGKCFRWNRGKCINVFEWSKAAELVVSCFCGDFNKGVRKGIVYNVYRTYPTGKELSEIVVIGPFIPQEEEPVEHYHPAHIAVVRFVATQSVYDIKPVRLLDQNLCWGGSFAYCNDEKAQNNQPLFLFDKIAG